MGRLLEKIGSKDTSLAVAAEPGLPLVGIVPPSGRWGQVPLPSGISEDVVQTGLTELLRTHGQ